MRRSLVTLGVLAGLLSPLLVEAQVNTLPNVVTGVVGSAPLTTNVPGVSVACGATAGVGACRLAGLFVYAVQRGRLIIGAFAFLMMVVAGFRLVISQSDEALQTARRTVLASFIGIFLVFISEQFIDALYGGFSSPAGSRLDTASSVQQGAIILSDELLGFLRWGETIVAIVAVGLIVIQAIAVLGSFGSEDTIRKAYRAVWYTVLGLALIVFDRVFAAIFGYGRLGDFPGPPDATVLIVEIFGLIRFLLAFVIIIIVGVMVYAAFLMLANYGNDELITRGKNFLISAGVGLLLIVISFVIISTIILGLA